MSEPDIDTAYHAAIEAGKIHGAIICATDTRGDFTYTSLIGQRTLLSGEKRPHQLNDILFLASATKLMATLAALACVDDGLLTLTGDLSTIAPELAAKQILTGFSDDGQPILEPQTKGITLEQLITHSSGLVYHFINPTIAKWREQNAPQAQTSNAGKKFTVEELINYPLAFQPGSAWMYGPGLDWAGRIVERVTNKTLGEYLLSRVFAAIGITDAQFYPVTREDLRARMVDLNPEDPDGLGRAVLGGGGDMNLTTKGDFGGHGLFMTAEDYLKALRSILANDGKILKPATVDGMFESHLSAEAAESHKAAMATPFGGFFRVGVAPGSKAGYGLGGLLTQANVEGWYGEKTLTWGGGMTFSWFIDRQNDLCGVGALQAKLPIDIPAIEELKQTFRKDIYRKRVKQSSSGS